MVDIFGPWKELEDLTMAEASGTCLPPPLVALEDVLEAHIEVNTERIISYKAFDALRERHGIDVTALTISMTRAGNAYRSFVLAGGSTMKR